MKYVLFLLTLPFLIACSDPEAEAAVAKKQNELEMYQSQIQKVKARVDSINVQDQKRQEDLKKLDMER